jgi:hypothetical protein
MSPFGFGAERARKLPHMAGYANNLGTSSILFGTQIAYYWIPKTSISALLGCALARYGV